MLGLIVVLVFLVAWAPALLRLIKAARSSDREGRALIPSLKRSAVFGAVVSVALIGLLVATPRWIDYLWAADLGFGDVYLTRLETRFGAAAVFALFGGALTLLITKLVTAMLPDRRQLARVRCTGKYCPVKVRRVALAVAVAAWWAIVGAVSWDEVLLALKNQAVGEVDPLFGKDIGFYLFRLPLIETVLSTALLAGVIAWSHGVAEIIMLINSTPYDWDERERRRGIIEKHFSRVGPRLAAAVGTLIPIGLLFAYVQLWRYDLLLSGGCVYGAGYADIHGWLPAYQAWSVLLLVLSALVLVIALRPSLRLAAWALGAEAAMAVLVLARPFGVQTLSVKPAEFAKEEPYLARNLEATRRAFGLDKVETQAYQPRPLAYEDLQKIPETLANIRLADWRSIQQILDQRQEIRQYYDFPDVDIDRYVVDGKYRQVLLATRELNTDLLPGQSRTWNNLHLVYTHGYGIALTLAGDFEPTGHPRMRIQNIPPVSDVPEIKISRPEIYFGELTKEHVYVNTGLEEFSYPQEGRNAYTKFTGKAGLSLGTGLRRLAFAWTLDGWPTLASRYLTAESRVLMHREIHERIRMAAPFLKLDEDTYKVIRDDGTLVYVQDCYTFSDRWPYSEPCEGVNYIRNSVKAIVNAYDGRVTFYVLVEDDPIIKAWQAVFPGMFKPAAELPADIRRHLRYPEDLLRIQAEVWATYHMEDLQKFYGREDRWQVANEKYHEGAQPVEPYSVVINLPGHEHEEFLLMVPFTPYNKDNAVGWMAGRADGDQYGKLLVYKMPQTEQVWGPMQVEAEVDQDPVMSQNLTLWKGKGSDVTRGNTLMIPLDGGLLYVEPIYIRAEQSAIPRLSKVVVFCNGRVAWDDTFDGALRKVFGKAPAASSSPSEASPSSFDQPLAGQLYKRYLTLMGEGKSREAGEALEELGRVLNAMPQPPAPKE